MIDNILSGTFYRFLISGLNMLFWLAFLAPMALSGNEDAILVQADQFFEAKLYERAIPLYQRYLHSPLAENESPNTIMQARMRLAESEILTQEYANAIAVLHAKPVLETSQLRELYLLGLAYNKLGEYENAANNLSHFLSTNDTSALFYDEAQFELGLALFNMSQFDEARKILNLVASQDGSRLSALSMLYLARIDMAECHLEGARNRLSQLKLRLLPENPINFQLAYLLGEIDYQNEEFTSAISRFEESLPKNKPEEVEWYADTLYYLSWCYLKKGHNSPSHQDIQDSFNKAELILLRLVEYMPEERVFLSLGQCYLARGEFLKEEEAYRKAEQILSRQDLFISREAQAHALLLRAEATPEYAKRDLLYRHLTQEAHSDTSYYARGWYLRGLNDFEEGQKLLSSNQIDQAHVVFSRSISAFTYAFELLEPIEKELAGLAIKYKILALYHLQTGENDKEALSLINSIVTSHQNVLQNMKDPDELFYFKALVSARLWKSENNISYIALAEEAIAEGLNSYPNGKFADAMYNLKGLLYFKQQMYREAEDVFIKLPNLFPRSQLCGEALFWAACSAESMNDALKAREYRLQVFEKYPNSCYAAEAYFSLYSYHDYVQGNRFAIKHLQAMAEKYPRSPLLMQGWYLIGLDYRRDRKSPEGKWIRKRNHSLAIQAFQEVETLFDVLYTSSQFTDSTLLEYVILRYRAHLERAMTNLEAAEESEGAKRQIYAEYAEEAFQKILSDFSDEQHALHHCFQQAKECTNIQEESTFFLAQACIKGHKDGEAAQILTRMLDKYHSAKITRGYYLSRAWYEKSLIAMRRQEYSLALEYLNKAEDAAKGKVLSIDQKLDLWIQQSMCYRAMQEWDQALLALSKAINDDAISSLRVKAMYLRGEVYELQGRRELARRQLDATSRKGGEWALKAKEKLGIDYGYQYDTSGI